MFDRSYQTEKSGLEKAIDSVLQEMTQHRSDSDEYKKMVDQLTKLYALQKIEEDHRFKEAEFLNQQKVEEADSLIKERLTDADCHLKEAETSEKLKSMEHPWRVSADTLAIVAGNLLGIALIIGHERAHVVTSKALNFVMKTR